MKSAGRPSPPSNAYAETVKKLEAARAAYNEVAPLTPEAAAGSRNWIWGCTPWPWEG